LIDYIEKLATFNNVEPRFGALYERVKQNTMTSIEALYALYKSVEYTARGDIPGDIVECGVGAAAA
jgi:O-methyltransferase